MADISSTFPQHPEVTAPGPQPDIYRRGLSQIPEQYIGDLCLVISLFNVSITR